MGGGHSPRSLSRRTSANPLGRPPRHVSHYAACMSSEKKQREYWVYVIEYDADWIVEKGKVYVGYTGLTPEERLERHRNGGQPAAKVFKLNAKNRGTNLRLRPDLAEASPNHAGPWPTLKEALVHERKLSNLLKAHGYVVKVGLGTPFSKVGKKAKKAKG